MMRGTLIGIFGILLVSSTTLGFAQTDSEIFPEWVKTTIKFWADGLVTDTELKNRNVSYHCRATNWQT